MDSKPNISEVNAEFAAKRACKLLGLDPDERLATGLRWELMLADVYRQYAINSALMEAGCGMARIERK